MKFQITPQLTCSCWSSSIIWNISVSGCKINWEINLTININPKWPKEARTRRTGDAKSFNRSKSDVQSSWWALLWSNLSDRSNIGVHEANFLGTELGCNGANLLLCHIVQLCTCLHVFLKNIQRAQFWRLLSTKVQGEANEDHGCVQLRQQEVQRAL